MQPTQLLLKNLLTEAPIAMTLISMTVNHGFPIMMGDLLTTSPEVSKELIIPALSMGVNKYLPKNKKFLPSKLIQKIYIITDSIAIGFIGSEYEIKLFLDDFINNFKYRESTFEEINRFANDYDKKAFANSSAGILSFDKSAFLFHTTLVNYEGWRFLDSPEFGKMYSCGSGSEYFIEKADEKTFLGKEETDSLTKAIVRNYCLLSDALATEVTSLETIYDNWGGGFEMIYFDGNKFVKMDNVTYVYWVGEVDLTNNTFAVLPYFYYNLKYIDDILLITVINCDSRLDTKKRVMRHVVPPLYKNPEEIKSITLPKQEDMDINSGRICNVFEINIPGVGTMDFSRFIISPEVLGKGVEYNEMIGIKGQEYLFSEGKFTFPIRLIAKKDGFTLQVSDKYMSGITEFIQNDLRLNLHLKDFKLKQVDKTEILLSSRRKT